MKASAGMLASLFLICTACGGGEGGNLFEGAADVGNPRLKGSFRYDKATKAYALTGAGTNMWLQNDEFFMVWKKETGDFSLSARVAFKGEGVNAHRKLGLIIRQSLAGDSKYADVAVHGDGLTSLQYRDASGGETKEIVAANSHADHITLERTGKTIRMKTAAGKYTQEVTAEVELDLPEACYVGLFVCSHEADALETAFFSGLSYNPR
jgi:regulation of enolase protein 1 (concanavalin A-like superfamily)